MINTAQNGCILKQNSDKNIALTKQSCVPNNRTMSKQKKARAPLVRSDKNLLSLGLFSAALLIAVFVYADYGSVMASRQSQAAVNERTYRVETVPAAITSEEDQSATDSEQVNAQGEMPDSVSEY